MELVHNRYYLYRHVRLDKNQPFYIGIGTKPVRSSTHETEYRRAFRFCDRKPIWKKIAEKSSVRVDIMLESDSYDDIKALEIYFISLYGRINNHTGILTNLTDGGEGSHGRVWTPTQEHIEITRKANQGRTLTPEHLKLLNDGRRNTPVSAESRLRYSLAKRGVRMTDETKEKQRASRMGGKNWNSKKVINIRTGEKFDCAKDAASFYKMNYTTLTTNLKHHPHRLNLRYYE